MDLQQWKLNSKVIEKIKLLNAERKHRVKIRTGLLAQAKDEQLHNHYKRIQSIPGVGKVLAFNMLIKIDGFKTINTPRQMACYAGIAPFDFQSGTSIRRKPKVS